MPYFYNAHTIWDQSKLAYLFFLILSNIDDCFLGDSSRLAVTLLDFPKDKQIITTQIKL